MKKVALLVLLLLGWQPVQANPFSKIKDFGVTHKRFELMEGAAVAGALIHRYGLHHCRLGGVERCDEHYGAAWAMFGFTTGLTTIVLPAIAEGCWKDSQDAKFCYVFAYSGSSFQTGWGIHEATIPIVKRPDDFSSAKFVLK